MEHQYEERKDPLEKFWEVVSSPVHELVGDWILPRFDELTLFTMSVTTVLLFAIDDSFRQDLQTAIEHDPKIIFAIIFAVIGLFISFLEAFLDHERSRFEMYMLLMFGIAFQVGISCAAIYHMPVAPLYPPPGYEQTQDQVPAIFLIFPLWNLLYGVYLSRLIRPEVLDAGVLDRKGYGTICFGIVSLVVIILVIVLHGIYSFHWTLSGNILIALSAGISFGVEEYFFDETESN